LIFAVDFADLYLLLRQSVSTRTFSLVSVPTTIWLETWPFVLRTLHCGTFSYGIMTVAQKLQAFWNHPAGPKTIHFWAPTFKWGISLANIADINRPAEKISLPQQCAITATGIIWSRYSTQITPVNYNLLAVNAFMAVTGAYQLFRKISYDMAQPAVTP
ncbi:hypothetical protein Vafri_3424, partial [Volvox africanus]